MFNRDCHWLLPVPAVANPGGMVFNLYYTGFSARRQRRNEPGYQSHYCQCSRRMYWVSAILYSPHQLVYDLPGHYSLNIGVRVIEVANSYTLCRRCAIDHHHARTRTILLGCGFRTRRRRNKRLYYRYHSHIYVSHTFFEIQKNKYITSASGSNLIIPFIVSPITCFVIAKTITSVKL
jgi:hypothetical protein